MWRNSLRLSFKLIGSTQATAAIRSVTAKHQRPHNKTLHPTAYSSARRSSSLRFRQRVSLSFGGIPSVPAQVAPIVFEPIFDILTLFYSPNGRRALEWFPGVSRAQLEAALDYEVQTLTTAAAA